MAEEEKKKPGRPKGSKNKPKEQEKRKPGRPVGSKNKRKPGRPMKKIDTNKNNTGAELIKTATSYLRKTKDLTPGENAEVTQFLMDVMTISMKADRNNIETLYGCLREYVQYCYEHDIRITNTGCYTACRLGKDDIDNWASGKYRSSDPRYKEFARYVRMFCTMNREQMMMSGKLNPIIGIWWQKVYDRYSDQVPVMQDDGVKTLDEGMSAEDIAKKYEDLATD